MKYVDLKVIEFTVPLNGQSVTVYRPPGLISRFCAAAHSPTHPDIFGDPAAMVALAPWASLAEVSKDALIWIPKSGHEPKWMMDACPACDLVLSHHTRQLRPSDWKVARFYAKNGKPRTISIPCPEKVGYHRWNGELRPYERPLTIYVDAHSNTVFVAGEDRVYKDMYEDFLSYDGCISGDHDHISPKNWDREELTITLILPEDWKP